MVALVLSKRARKDLARVPSYIAEKARLWIAEVREGGLQRAQANAKWKDESKEGRLRRVRAIWLSREYRLFYDVKQEIPVVVTVLEVNRHDYKKIERRYR